MPAVVGPVQWSANSRPQGDGVSGPPSRTPASAARCRNGASGGARSGTMAAAAATWVCRFGEVATRTRWSPVVMICPTSSAPPRVVGRRVWRASAGLVGQHQEKMARTPSTARIAVACPHRQNHTRVEWGTRRRPVQQIIETSVNGLSLLGSCTASWRCPPRPGRLPPTRLTPPPPPPPAEAPWPPPRPQPLPPPPERARRRRATAAPGRRPPGRCGSRRRRAPTTQSTRGRGQPTSRRGGPRTSR